MMLLNLEERGNVNAREASIISLKLKTPCNDKEFLQASIPEVYKNSPILSRE